MNTADHYLDIISRALSSIPYPSEPAGLYEPIRYTLESGGKRLRPTLVLAACDACGCNPETAVNQALGLEIFHNFTLLHDDVMDRSDMRRGRPTVHMRWNESTAILSGDAMLTMASILMGRCDDSCRSKVLDFFNHTAMEIYEGQQYDMDFETRTDVTVDEYLKMIRLKTSVLIGCACALGAIVAKASDITVNALYSYGVELGLAFQLQDDWLDTFGDPILFGKNIGGDIKNDKKTFLLITTLENVSAKERATIIGLSGERSEEKVRQISSLYRSTGAETLCREKIKQCGDKAIEALKRADISQAAVKYFSEIVVKSLNRDY